MSNQEQHKHILPVETRYAFMTTAGFLHVTSLLPQAVVENGVGWPGIRFASGEWIWENSDKKLDLKASLFLHFQHSQNGTGTLHPFSPASDCS